MIDDRQIIPSNSLIILYHSFPVFQVLGSISNGLQIGTMHANCGHFYSSKSENSAACPPGPSLSLPALPAETTRDDICTTPGYFVVSHKEQRVLTCCRISLGSFKQIAFQQIPEEKISGHVVQGLLFTSILRDGCLAVVLKS